MEINLEELWVKASAKKIQQIKEEWEWLIQTAGLLELDKPNILEIGCYDGGSSWYLNQFSKNMVSVDNHVPCMFDHSDWTNYQYFGMDSHSPEIVNIIKLHEWDFVFIDGDHTYDGVKTDFMNILPFLKKGTRVAFHDIVISDVHHAHNCYVGEFWEDLKKEYPSFTFSEIKKSNDWAGIGILWI